MSILDRISVISTGFVSPGSKRTYHEKLALFTFCLIDEYPEYLVNDHREELQRLDELDKDNADTSDGKKDNRTRAREFSQGAI